MKCKTRCRHNQLSLLPNTLIMIQKVSATIVLFSSLFSACTSQPKTKQNTEITKDTVAPAAKENFAKGEVIDQVVCRGDASQSFALYLPTTYTSEKTYPIIFAFDAHGTGKLPLVKYKELAEQYGYIMVGSNNSKNGNSWEESQRIAELLFADVETRLSVNTKRIYVLGFSGGARVANGLTILNGAIAGAICNSAAAPAANSKTPRNNYTWLGIGGTEDFNLIEMLKYDRVDLAGHNVKHALITFDGKHEWCPKETMDEAFWWLELCEMRNNLASKNDAEIKKRLEPIQKQVETLLQKKEMYDAFLLCKKTVNFYDGLADLSFYLSTYKTLKTDITVDKSMKLEEVSWSKEEKLKQFYSSGFQSTDFERWKKEIASLNQKIKSESKKSEVQMYKRVLGYLSLASYMQASGALKQNAITAADYLCKVYVLVDPTNSEAHYLNASVAARQGKSKEAIASLNDAIKNGYDDLPRLQTDSSFVSIKTMKEFEEIVGKINKK